MDAPRPTQGAPRADLEERLLGVRRALERREESPSGDWVEETARDLAGGAKPGWYLPGAGPGGIAFCARRAEEAYGHVHADPGPSAGDRALDLATSLLEGLPADVRSVNLGFTGLEDEEELACARRLGARPGSTILERRAMERTLTAADGVASPNPPASVRMLPVGEVTLDALADLDRRAFEGTGDAFLVGPGFDGYRQALGSMLEGRLGRFVDEASIALVEPAPLRLVGAVLSTEQSIHRAVLVDLMVDPDRQRRGLGRFLMTWVLRALWALGYTSVRLWVTEANRPARALYDAFGFRPIGRAAVYRWDRPAPGPHPQLAR
ncbi:MAG: GNAT family N-acetyltransferase [Thermoplasmata archaeon]